MTWKDIVGFEGLYMVSDAGTITSVSRIVTHRGFDRFIVGKEKKQQLDKYGYKCIKLSKDGRKHHFTVHRLVATAFIDNPKNKAQVNHIDGDKTNNSVENIEWCTAKENVSHSWKFGISKSQKGIPRNNKVEQPKRRRPVLQISQSGQSIILHDSISDAIGYTATHIVNCCKGKVKMHKGYRWEYA